MEMQHRFNVSNNYAVQFRGDAGKINNVILSVAFKITAFHFRNTLVWQLSS